MDYGYIGGADGPTAVFVASSGWEWNPINWFGAITVLLILLPNIIYAVKCRGQKNLCTSKALNILEQIGRYGSMLFMVVYVGPKNSFGFGSVFALLAYLFGNVCLILSYWCVWGVYLKMKGVFKRQEKGSDGPTAIFITGHKQIKKVIGLEYTLAILPAAVFLLDSLCLLNYPLAICGVIFAIGHVGVTRENIRNKTGQNGEQVGIV